MILFNATVRNNSLANETLDYLLAEYPEAVPFELYEHTGISREYLSGDPDFDEFLWRDHNFMILISSSYYNFPPAVFLNWLCKLSREQVQVAFQGKKILLVSCQGGENLNELPVSNLRQLFQKVWDYNDVKGEVCVKHAMINHIPDPRLLHLIKFYRC